MQATRYYALLILGFVLGFASCNLNPDKPELPGEDNKPPVIIIEKPTAVDSPAYFGNYFLPNDSIKVKFFLSDNIELMQYQIDLIYRGDLYYLKTQADTMVGTVIGYVQGTEITIERVFLVELDPISGPYEIQIKGWDKAGHVTQTSTFIYVQNGDDQSMPFINISAPAPNQVFSIGTNISVTFSAGDNVGLFDAVLRVRNRFSKELIPDGYFRFESIFSAGSHDFYIHPVTPGDYDVEVYVKDSNHNLTLVKVPITITTF